MASPIYLNGPVDPDLAAALQRYLGTIVAVSITGPAAYEAEAHQCRLLRLAAGLGAVDITIPEDTPVGHSFVCSSPADSWPHFVAAGGGALEHPYGHTRGLPNGLVSVLVVANAGGSSAIVALSGATQP